MRPHHLAYALSRTSCAFAKVKEVCILPADKLLSLQVQSICCLSCQETLSSAVLPLYACRESRRSYCPCFLRLFPFFHFLFQVPFLVHFTLFISRSLNSIECHRISEYPDSMDITHRELSFKCESIMDYESLIAGEMRVPESLDSYMF